MPLSRFLGVSIIVVDQTGRSAGHASSMPSLTSFAGSWRVFLRRSDFRRQNIMVQAVADAISGGLADVPFYGMRPVATVRNVGDPDVLLGPAHSSSVSELSRPAGFGTAGTRYQCMGARPCSDADRSGNSRCRRNQGTFPKRRPAAIRLPHPLKHRKLGLNSSRLADVRIHGHPVFRSDHIGTQAQSGITLPAIRPRHLGLRPIQQGQAKLFGLIDMMGASSFGTSIMEPSQ